MKTNDTTMRQRQWGTLLVCCLFLLILSGCGQNQATVSAPTSPSVATSSHSSHATPAATEVAQNVPHYFDDPEKAKPFPKTLDPAQVNSPAAKKAYETARRIPEVLVQQPCYCYCDRGFGHGSLLDCHKDNHSADWQVCLQEVLLADKLNREGKSAKDIRAAIIRGEWKKVELPSK